jgi:lipoate-protein ligase A
MNETVWIDTASRPAWQQMAIDRAMVAIAAGDDAAILRLYQWQRDSLSLGANEVALRTWDRQRLERDEVPCVRRPTGGRGVWHAADDLTYSWAGLSGGPAGVRRVYRLLHGRLGRAIESTGTATDFAPAPEGGSDLRPGSCFERAVGGELIAEGRKVLGSAQKVFGAHLLQHGAFARVDRSGALSGYRLEAAPQSESTGIPNLPPACDLASVIRQSWLDSGATVAGGELTRAIERASVEYQEVFRDPAWTWRR